MTSHGFWSSEKGTTTAAIDFNFPASVTINGFRVKAANTQSLQEAGITFEISYIFTLDVSSDGEEWITAFEGGSVTLDISRNSDWLEFSFFGVKAKYFRLNIIGNITNIFTLIDRIVRALD